MFAYNNAAHLRARRDRAAGHRPDPDRLPTAAAVRPARHRARPAGTHPQAATSASPGCTCRPRRSPSSASSTSQAGGGAATQSCRTAGSSAATRRHTPTRHEPEPATGGRATASSSGTARHGYRGDGAYGQFCVRAARAGRGADHHGRHRRTCRASSTWPGRTCCRRWTVPVRPPDARLAARLNGPEVGIDRRDAEAEQVSDAITVTGCADTDGGWRLGLREGEVSFDVPVGRDAWIRSAHPVGPGRSLEIAARGRLDQEGRLTAELVLVQTRPAAGRDRAGPARGRGHLADRPAGSSAAARRAGHARRRLGCRPATSGRAPAAGSSGRTGRRPRRGSPYRSGGSEPAAAFARACSGERAPGITVLTPGLLDHPGERGLGRRDLERQLAASRLNSPAASTPVSKSTPEKVSPTSKASPSRL